MSQPLVTYCQDHLAGSRFAVSLLNDLAAQTLEPEAAEIAAALETEISADQRALEDFINRLGADNAPLKDAAAWVAQKASRAKLDMTAPVGVFEAVEMISIGVLGKRALWIALSDLRTQQSAVTALERTLDGVLDGVLDLESLLERAQAQFETLETLRRRLALKILGAK